VTGNLPNRLAVDANRVTLRGCGPCLPSSLSLRSYSPVPPVQVTFRIGHGPRRSRFRDNSAIIAPTLGGRGLTAPIIADWGTNFTIAQIVHTAAATWGSDTAIGTARCGVHHLFCSSRHRWLGSASAARVRRNIRRSLLPHYSGQIWEPLPFPPFARASSDTDRLKARKYADSSQRPQRPWFLAHTSPERLSISLPFVSTSSLIAIVGVAVPVPDD
jgi:hypothetical protein